MSKKRKNRNIHTQQADAAAAAQKKRATYGNIMRLLCLIATTMAVFCIYRFFIDKYYFNYVLAVYIGIATVAIFSYVIYNRGFSRKGLTPEMLPDTMSKEEKEEFIEDGKRRLRKSRPLLILVFAFVFTFLFDLMEITVLPLFKEMLGL